MISVPIIVSDHALVRWLERMHGIDMEFFRTRIADECREALEAGATCIKRAEGSFVLNPAKQTVVTVLAPEMGSIGNRAKHLRARREGIDT